MKIELLSSNKIKYSITLDELSDKGFLQEGLWKDSFLWHDLFDEMLEEANKIFNLNASGSVAIEIYSFTTEELILILTVDDENEWMEKLYNYGAFVKKMNDEKVVFSFDSLEDLLALVQSFHHLQLELDCKLYFYEEKYMLVLNRQLERVLLLCEEFGNKTTVSNHVLEEYGKLILEKNTIGKLATVFLK